VGTRGCAAPPRWGGGVPGQGSTPVERSSTYSGTEEGSMKGVGLRLMLMPTHHAEG
jgi:hypothetical protein